MVSSSVDVRVTIQALVPLVVLQLAFCAPLPYDPPTYPFSVSPCSLFCPFSRFNSVFLPHWFSLSSSSFPLFLFSLLSLTTTSNERANPHLPLKATPPVDVVAATAAATAAIHCDTRLLSPRYLPTVRIQRLAHRYTRPLGTLVTTPLTRLLLCSTKQPSNRIYPTYVCPSVY